MNDRIRQAFDGVHADDVLKTRTKAFVAQKTRRGLRVRFSAPVRLAVAAACLVLMFAAGYRLYFIPTASISIDVNPSIELGVNRFNRVVSVRGINEDGQELADSLELLYAEYRDAVAQILDSSTITVLLENDAFLSIAVVAPEGAQASEMLAQMESCTAGRENAQCYCVQPEEVAAAHEAGLSYGKYRAFLEWQALDPNATVEDAQGMTMREIRDCIDALTSGSEASDTQHGNGRRGNGRS